MKILFIQLLTRKNEREIFPIGYGNIMGYVEKHGHECDILFPRAFFMSNAEIAEHVRKTDAQVIGMGGMFNDLFRAVELAEIVRSVRPDLKIVIGGPMTTYSPLLAMRKTGADYGVCGDGEIATLKILNTLHTGEGPTGIPGVVTRDGDVIIKNGFAEQMNMDNVEFPNWDKLPMEYFLHQGQGMSLGEMFSGDYRGTFSWVFSRGCIGRCNFCSPGGKPRFMSVERLVDQLEELYRRFDLKTLHFSDNIIAPSKTFLLELCENIVSRGMEDIDFTGNLRANQIDHEVAEALKYAGFTTMGMGIESANNTLLKAMHKNITVQDIDNAITIMKDAGLNMTLSCMFGQPNETIEDCVNTLMMFKKSSDVLKANYNMHFFSPLYTYPGSPIYDWAIDQGYYKNENDFYNEFFIEKKYGYKNYTSYTDEMQWRFIKIGRTINEWQHHKNMKFNYEQSLLSQYNSVCELNELPKPVTSGPLEAIDEALCRLDLSGKRVALYGISDVAETVAAWLERESVEIVAACDGTLEKQGKPFHGVDVVSIDSLEPDAYDVMILCTKSQYSDQGIIERIRQSCHDWKRCIRLFSMIQKRKLYRAKVDKHAECSNEHEALDGFRRMLREML